MKVLLVAGARPNFMKIAPISAAFRRFPEVEALLVHTGQHYDRSMSQSFFSDLGLAGPDFHLGVAPAEPVRQIASIMLAFDKIVLRESPDVIIVVGDVNSSLAGALVANKRRVTLAHVEAGLRSGDRDMPEEYNRILIDHMADFLFTTSQQAGENLLAEGIPSERIFFVGNTMIDTLFENLEKARRSAVLEDFGLQSGSYALLTLHRPSNVDVSTTFWEILAAIAKIQYQLPVIWPLHPRSEKRLKKFGFYSFVLNLPNLFLSPPLGYLDFLCLMDSARMVLTDSGGIQEETTVLGIPCLTLRTSTERPITVSKGTNVVVGVKEEAIVEAVERILQTGPSAGSTPELWDGHAAKRIVDILMGSRVNGTE